MPTALILSVLTLPTPDPLDVDLLFFPSMTVCETALADGQAHLKFWQERAQIALIPGDEEIVQAYCKQVALSLEAWRYLYAARCSASDSEAAVKYHWRERWLSAEMQELREIIGEDCYQRGIMPYPVAPHWREWRPKMVTIPKTQ